MTFRNDVNCISADVTIMLPYGKCSLCQQVRIINEEVTFINKYPYGIYLPSINRTFRDSRYVYASCPLDQCTNTIMVCAEDFNPEWWRQYTTSAAAIAFSALNTWIIKLRCCLLLYLLKALISGQMFHM